VTINGRRSPLCVIQESRNPESEQDFISALQTVLADTSWFTRTVIEKLKAFRQGAHPEGRALSDEIDILSDREREVLGLICEGRSDAEMSKILQLSPNTVRNHIGALYRKIGVNRRSGAIIWARERGITCFELAAPKRRRRAIEHSNAQRE
jgi:DNA-binding CsgD family transcriptional regulator